MTFCALLLSLHLAFSIFENFSSFIDIPQGYIPEIGLSGILFVLSLLIIGGILSTVFSFANFKVKSLSSLLKTGTPGKSGKENLFGRTSVILQFIVAQTVIIATFFIIKQIYFVNHKDLGYNTENIIFARVPENQSFKLNELKAGLSAIPAISDVAYSSVVPAESHSWTNFSIFRDNGEITIDAEIKSIDSSFLNLYSFTFLAGHNFSANDTSGNVIVNSEFIIETGFGNAEEAIGARIQGYGDYSAYIKGVVKDFNSGSLHDKIRPCLFANIPQSFSTVNIRLAYSARSQRNSPDVLTGDLEKINLLWGEVFPGQPFEYTFLSDRITAYYKAEYKALNLFLLFALVTIFLCVLGILGLSLSMNERKTKEIGIRKVNGAKVTEVLLLLNKDFFRWVTVAFVFAVPVSWLGMQKWLENFAYKTELSWWIFALAGVIALVIVILTVSWHSWRAATRNPVKALRYE